MTYARKSLICLNDTPYYHVVARCVRRAWLWGFDEYAGRDYSHRKEWVLERLSALASVFAIDICAYAVMSNHYHLVLRVDQRRAKSWTQNEVVDHWTKLHSTPTLVARWQQGECGEAECEVVERLIQLWRRRLTDISWYMRSLNEHLARRANAEDGCKGRFWEGRFKSQALLDEAGLLTAMVYVDLNPIRAQIARTPEESDFTSVEARIRSIATSTKRAHTSERQSSAHVPVPLLSFADSELPERSIPYRALDYLELVDWTGRILRDDKRGAMSPRLPALMHRLGIEAIAWQGVMQPAGNVFGRALGRLDHLRLHAEMLKQSWIRGQRASSKLYSTKV
jgi:REP element-mobilizing transposase RayT